MLVAKTDQRLKSSVSTVATGVKLVAYIFK